MSENNVDLNAFESRHLGLSEQDCQTMLKELGYKNFSDFYQAVVPETVQSKSTFKVQAFDQALSEAEAIKKIREYANQNQVWRSYIGLGYYGTLPPAVIIRNILENPGWYTQYTPYQPEISQGRLEALLNYQTMISDLTGCEVANASLLDEGTAAAEAMVMAHAVVERKKQNANKFLISEACHPQTKAVVITRAEALGIEVLEVNDLSTVALDDVFGVLIQYPDTYGRIIDFTNLSKAVHQANAILICATDLLALTLLTAPAELGADIVLGSSQRFGVPLGYGGPHAAFFACRDEYKRLMPGRIIGVSIDRHGNSAMRLTLQTREQHIRREKATSNICTAQVLLAIMAGMYAVYHGPKRLTSIANQVKIKTEKLAGAISNAGLKLLSESFFDTLVCQVAASDLKQINDRAISKQINLRIISEQKIAVSLDETISELDLQDLVWVFTGKNEATNQLNSKLPAVTVRKNQILSHSVFNTYHTETEFLRYIRRLESKDLSLATAMIPLGSCTMKLNATSEMLPVTWSEFANLHPFAPREQAQGYALLFADLESALADVTGLDAVSLQPNAGSQGEYAGLLAIAAYHKAQSALHRRICLIPKSAHGTNPASAVMAGFEVVVVECDSLGNIDLGDLETKIKQHQKNLAALMLTYPSTHGVFESTVKQISEMVHQAGGLVYFDGANLNALVGLVKVGELGADVVHINLHKTFCIPHGGGGPGMGPIAVNKKLANFLPGHPVVTPNTELKNNGPVSAAPWGSAAILPISWMYMAMMGTEGLRKATLHAILSANYIAKKLKGAFPVLFTGQNSHVAHECIIDLRGFKASAGIEVDDIAKRLMDYGFHAPTVSWPVAGTMMIEPTESESKAEVDRFIDALLAIRAEIQAIESGKSDKQDNLLKNAPHTLAELCADNWQHAYSREAAGFPTTFQKTFKFWPAVGRVDSAYGDRNVVCTCPAIEDYAIAGNN